jgi:hypothetical protein
MKIQIENRTKIPTKMIECIVSNSILPAGEVLLFVGQDEMAGNANDFGQCIPRLAQNLQGSCLCTSAFRDLDWDAGILLSTKACDYYYSHPAFFAELLGHELGHAALCLIDPVFHAYCTFICNNFRGKWRITWNKFPHEKRFEQYGKAVAEATYSHEQLEKEIKNLLLEKNRNDRIILCDLLDLECCMDLTGIREGIVEFVSRHGGHEQVIQLWNEDHRESIQENSKSITLEVPSIENLFNSPQHRHSADR